MRRDARRAKKENWWENKKFWIGGGVAILIVAFVLGVSIYSGNSKNTTDMNRADTNQIISLVPEDDNETNTESASSSIGNTIENTIDENTTNEVNTTNTNTQATNTTKATTKTNTALENETTKNESASNTVVTSSKTEEKEISFAWPVEGEILKAFSVDSLLYSSTLKEWVTHNGIDIRADKTTIVKAVADGTVKSIKNDPRYGLTVVIEHSDNFKTVYSNLLTSEFVVEGEKVTQGQSIGTVGNTATFEIADDSHLHFEMLKDGEYVDPTIYLK